MNVSIVSGTYNRLELLKAMVGSVRNSVGFLEHEIVLVDGGSTDGTIEWCNAQDDIVLIEHGELLGAIKAYNDGCEAAQGEYVVIGNDDITFVDNTILLAYSYLQANPEVGQAAFGHKYQRRGQPDVPKVQGAYGYTYGQCCMTPKFLGDLAGWWGDEGMLTYGGDTRFSLRLWEMGYPTVQVDGCAVIDSEHEDELRQINSDSPWRTARKDGKPHPDLVIFNRAWLERLPARGEWIPGPAKRVLSKAIRGNLRTMRFKGQMYRGAPLRTSMVDAFADYGAAFQIAQTDAVYDMGREKYQGWAMEQVEKLQPDLIILQAQRENNITPQTVWQMRERFPWIYIANWDGDTHYPLAPFHFEIARAVHLQLTVSPTLFPAYASHGAGVGYWPIGIEKEYLGVERGPVEGPGVLFTGALYGIGRFPEAEFRRDAVLALSESDLDFTVYGSGWQQVGLQVESTSEQHLGNAELMARAKMTLSISQTKDLWGYTSDRLYNITATGCPALVQAFEGMDEHGYVDGETCIAFKTFDEMLEKARYYIEHDGERERIGRNGREMTLSRHTWEHRVDGFFSMLEGLP